MRATLLKNKQAQIYEKKIQNNKKNILSKKKPHRFQGAFLN
jgi:hypothetical protein